MILIVIVIPWFARSDFDRLENATPNIASWRAAAA
jgi:hypothetical protein